MWQVWHTLQLLRAYYVFFQTVVAIVMGGIIYAIMRKVGKPIAEFLDGKSQVGWL